MISISILNMNLLTSLFIDSKFYACGTLQTGSVNTHNSVAVVIKLTSSVAITDLLVLENTANSALDISNIRWSFSYSGEHLVTHIVPSDGYAVTSYINLTNFNVLAGASKFTFT